MSLIKNVLLYLPQLYNTKLTSSLHSHIIYICTCQSHDNLLNYTGCVNIQHIVCSRPSTRKTKLKEIIEYEEKGMSVKFITQAAVIAAIYVVLVVIFNYISFGPVQFRIAEALTILPYFTPAAIPGLFVGCIIANILGGAIVWDVVFGSIATLIGAIGTYLLRKNKWLAPVPPIVANTIIVPFVLKFAYGSEGMFAMFFVTVGAGEIIVCGIIGMILLYALTPVRHVIFGDEK